MDSTVESGQHRRETIDTGDFAALFIQLDRPDACAPLESGFARLLNVMERLSDVPKSLR